MWKGIIPYVGYQHTGLIGSRTYVDSYLFGLRFYPVTHFEIILQASPDFSSSGGRKTQGESAFMMINAYF